MTWPDVVRVLDRADARELVLGGYRSAGFTPDDFAAKRPARAAMADALARLEDRLESSTSRRDAVRDLRRRLEWEVWP